MSRKCSKVLALFITRVATECARTGAILRPSGRQTASTWPRPRCRSRRPVDPISSSPRSVWIFVNSRLQCRRLRIWNNNPWKLRTDIVIMPSPSSKNQTHRYIIIEANNYYTMCLCRWPTFGADKILMKKWLWIVDTINV